MLRENAKREIIELSIQNVKYFYVKRMLDLFFAILLFNILLPIMTVVGLLILLLDGRPIFFKQIRTGQNGKPFIIWKFRTMVLHSHEDQHRYSWKEGVPNDFVFKSAVSPLTTKIGVILRKYSLDELPQLINVIKGDMSFIGPRPEIPQITKFYNQHQRVRLYVKPGITGYAQVHGRSDINHGEKITYDLFYVRNCSLLLDIKIIVKTIIQVFTSIGSY